MADDATMNQVLEAVADAVAQLVMFSVEAEENNSLLPNILPGAQAVQTAVDVLVDIATELAEKYGSEKKVQDKMFSAATEIREAMQQIVTHAQALSTNQFNQEAKKGLLRAAKSVLQGTVQELHLADKYDVIKLVRAAQLCKQDVERSSTILTTEQVMDLARGLSANMVSLVKLVNQRIAILVDPMLKRRLETANQTAKNGVQLLVKTLGDCIKQPSNTQFLSEQRRLARQLEEALDEIITVTNLSCKTMFDSLDLDFGLDVKRPTISDLRECHERIVRELGNLDAGVKQRRADEAAKALHLISSAVMQEVSIASSIADECDNDGHKLAILQACDDVERMPSELTPGAKAALQRSADESIQARLEHLEEATKEASAAVLAAVALSSSAKDKLREMAQDLARHLVELEEGVETGNKAKAAKAAKAVSDDVSNAVIISQAIADASTPETAQAIQVEIGTMNALLPQLVQSTKAGLADPGNIQILDKLHGEAVNMQAAADRLVDAATLTPEELLLKKTALLEEELRKLEAAVRAGDVREAAARLKAAREHIADQIRIAQALADACEDPVRKKKIEQAIADLQRLNDQLIPLSKAALAGDKAALAQLDALLEEAKRIGERLNAAAQPTDEEQLRKARKGLEDNLAELADSLDRGDLAGGRRALKEASNLLEREAGLLGRLQDDERDPQRKKQLAAVRSRLDELRPMLEAAGNAALADPQDAEARRRLEQATRNINQANEDLNYIFPSEEEKMVRLAAQIGRDLDELARATAKGDKPAAAAAVKAAVNDVGQQIDLANVLVERLPEGSLAQQRALEETENLKAFMPQLVQATKSVLQSPDPSTQAQLQSSVDDVNRSAHALAAAITLTPEQQIVEGATSLNVAFSNLQDDAVASDKPRVNADNRKLAKDVPRQVELVKRFVDTQGDNPLVKSQVEEAGAALQQLLPVLAQAAESVAANPRDKKKHAELNEAVEKAKSLNNSLLSVCTSPEEQIVPATTTLMRELQHLNKAVHDKDKPETEAALKALKEALDQHAMLTRQIARKEADPQRKREIEEALAALDALRPRFETLARAALNGDKAAEAELERTIRNAEELVNKIAQLGAQPTKQQILENARLLHHALNQVDNAVQQGARDAGKAALADVEKALLRQQNLVKAQAAKEHDPQRKQLLEQAQKALDDALKTLPDPARSSLLAGKNPALQSKARNEIKKAHDAVTLSEKAVSPSDVDTLLQVYRDLTNQIGRVPKAVENRDNAERDDALRAARAAADKEKELAQKLAGNNASQGQQVNRAAGNLDASLNKYLETVRAAAQDPRDKTKQQQLADAGDNVCKAAASLVALNVSSLKNEILDTNQHVEDALDKLAAAVRRGNRQEALDALQEADEGMAKLAALVRALADLTDDPAAKAALLQAAEELDNARHNLAVRTQEALAHPADKEAQANFNAAIQQARQANAGAVNAAHPQATQEILDNGKRLGQMMQQNLAEIKQGNRKAALATLDQTEKEMRRQAALCRAVGTKTADPAKRQQLIDASLGLQAGAGQLAGPVRNAVLKEGGEKEATEHLTRVMNDTARIHERVEAALVGKPEDEGPKDEIMQAAKQVETVIQTKDIDESTPEGRVYAASRRIAQEMALMSQAAARGNNSEVILSSRRIHALIQIIQTNATVVSQMCKDPILRDQVMSMVHAISNISVQLKIITAVKAAGGPTDPTVKAQLVKCAKGLASNVVNVCNAVEIACIRI
jgi:hypothetical protein